MGETCLLALGLSGFWSVSRGSFLLPSAGRAHGGATALAAGTEAEESAGRKLEVLASGILPCQVLGRQSVSWALREGWALLQSSGTLRHPAGVPGQGCRGEADRMASGLPGGPRPAASPLNPGPGCPV